MEVRIDGANAIIAREWDIFLGWIEQEGITRSADSVEELIDELREALAAHEGDLSRSPSVALRRTQRLQEAGHRGHGLAERGATRNIQWLPMPGALVPDPMFGVPSPGLPVVYRGGGSSVYHTDRECSRLVRPAGAPGKKKKVSPFDIEQARALGWTPCGTCASTR